MGWVASTPGGYPRRKSRATGSGDGSQENENGSPRREAVLERCVHVGPHEPRISSQSDEVPENQRQNHRIKDLRGDRQMKQGDSRNGCQKRSNDKLGNEEDIERSAGLVVAVQAAGKAEEFGEGIGGRKRHDDQPHESGGENADGEQRPGQVAGKGADGLGGLFADSSGRCRG